MSQVPLQVVSGVLKIEKQETAKETSDGNAPWEVVRAAGRPAPGFVQGPERSPETVWRRKPSLVWVWFQHKPVSSLFLSQVLQTRP